MKLGASSFKRSQPIAPQTEASEEEEEADELDISVLSQFGSQAEPTKVAPAAPPKIEPKPVIAAQTPPSTPLAKSTPEYTELFRLLRHPQTGQLIVAVGEEQYFKLTDIPTKQMGHYIFELTAHLLVFTNGMVATETGLKSLGVPKVAALPAAPPMPITPPSSPPVVAKPAVIAAPPHPKASSVVAKPMVAPAPPPKRTNLFGLPEPDNSLLGGFSLADQINEIVQKRLAYSSLGRTTTIEISTGLEGGIEIQVNDLVYQSADEVADLEVRALIKESIKEWERS